MRAALALQHLTWGYAKEPSDVIEKGRFSEGKEGSMVLAKSIDIYSLCEHHMLPFIGKVS